MEKLNNPDEIKHIECIDCEYYRFDITHQKKTCDIPTYYGKHKFHYNDKTHRIDGCWCGKLKGKLS